VRAWQSALDRLDDPSRLQGRAELSATVDYLFGYDATTGVAEDWMYEQVASVYLLDEDVAVFMRPPRTHAARAIAERLLESADRGLWAEPDDASLARVRDATSPWRASSRR